MTKFFKFFCHGILLRSVQVGAVTEARLVMDIVGGMPTRLGFPGQLLLNLMLACQHPFLDERESSIVITIAVIDLLFELFQSFFLSAFFPIEITLVYPVAILRH